MPCPLHQQERDPSCRAVQCWQDRVQAYISTTETLVREYRDLLGVHLDTEDHQRYHRILNHFKDPSVESILFRRTATNICVPIKYQEDAKEEAKEETKDSKATEWSSKNGKKIRKKEKKKKINKRNKIRKE